jgi:hypothetical protein
MRSSAKVLPLFWSRGRKRAGVMLGIGGACPSPERLDSRRMDFVQVGISDKSGWKAEERVRQRRCQGLEVSCGVGGIGVMRVPGMILAAMFAFGLQGTGGPEAV